MGGLNVQLASFTGHRVDTLRSRPRILSSEIVKAGAIDFGYRRIGDNLHSCREQDHPLALPILNGVDLAKGFVEGNFAKILLILIQVIHQREVTHKPEAKVRSQSFDLVVGNYVCCLPILVQNLFSCPSVVAFYVTKIRVDKSSPCLSLTRRAGSSPSPRSGDDLLLVRGSGGVRLYGAGRVGLSRRLERQEENE